MRRVRRKRGGIHGYTGHDQQAEQHLFRQRLLPWKALIQLRMHFVLFGGANVLCSCASRGRGRGNSELIEPQARLADGCCDVDLERLRHVPVRVGVQAVVYLKMPADQDRGRSGSWQSRRRLRTSKAFILDRNRMRMTHVYKPVMLQAVLRRRGAATKEVIASEIMSRDELQIEHYRRNIVHQMPGSRLIRDGILEQDGDTYRLAFPFDRLTEWQRLDSIAACERRLEEHQASYGDNFSNRSTDAVVGSVRYEALKRAGGRCELCGVSHEVRPLHVDHVRPRAKGGLNDLRNLQVLCETCNTQKRDRDDTEFRAVRTSFDDRDASCVFCQADGRIVEENELAFAIEDRFPVTSGHTLTSHGDIWLSISTFIGPSAWRLMICSRLEGERCRPSTRRSRDLTSA